MTINDVEVNIPHGATHYGDEGYWLVDEFDNVYMWVHDGIRFTWVYARPAQCLFACDIKTIIRPRD